jgi:hypothetical protein
MSQTVAEAAPALVPSPPERVDDPSVRPQSLAGDIAKKIVGFLPQICNMGEGLNTNFNVDRAAHHAVCTVASDEIFGLM